MEAMNIEEIKSLLEAVHKNEIGSLEIRDGEFRLKIEGKQPDKVMMSTPIYAQPINDAAPQLPAIPAASDAQQPAAPKGTVVKSPIVGTFYGAPAQDKPPYVKVGHQVKKGDVLFIIESMKLMNEVRGEVEGTVTEICVTDGTAVEYGQPILWVE